VLKKEKERREEGREISGSGGKESEEEAEEALGPITLGTCLSMQYVENNEEIFSLERWLGKEDLRGRML
jgi:hypothetical protein